MSLQTPTVQEISDNIVAQLEAALSQTVPLLPKAFTRVLASALGAVFVLIYKYAGFSLLQYFVATASFQDTEINGKTVNPLTEWGRLIGVGDPTDATRAELTADVTVLTQTGTLPAGSQLVRTETGVIYLTLSAVNLDAAVKTVTIRASSDQDGNGGAGAIGNLNPGDIVSFANPLPNVATDAVIVSQTVTGADGESEEVYRQRIIDRFRQQPQGGAYADYKLWSEEVEGILSAFPYTSDCPGEVDVYVEATEASSGSADGIPTAAQLQAVADSIELDDNGLPSRRPANALVNVFPITRTAFDVTVSGLTADNVSEAEAAITEAIDDYLRSREPFIVGLSRLPRADRITESAVGGVADEAASALGATITTVSLSSPAFTLDDGEKAKLGTISFI
jgi:uncharacterized phage protein gp47/JayE